MKKVDEYGSWLLDPEEKMPFSRDTAWIHTFTGRKIYPFDPKVEDICLEDIAHALSLQCRFTGHSKIFWSVADHSLLVSSLCTPQNRLWGLLHDASEAYLIDVARPVKHNPDFTIYRDAEKKLMNAICNRFKMDPVQPDEVKEADEIALATEAHQLMKDTTEWNLKYSGATIQLREREWEQTEWQFLVAARSLM